MKLITTNRYAAVTATMALVVALGGTSYAVTQIDKNSVGSKQIKNGSIKNKDIKNKTIKGKKIAKAAITTGKVKDDSLTGKDIDESTLGSVPAADAVDGNAISKVRYESAPAVGTTTTLFEGGGMRVTAECGALGVITLEAQSTADDGSLYATAIDGSADVFEGAVVEGGFDSGDTFDLLLGESGNLLSISFVYEGAGGVVATGQLATDTWGVQSCHVNGQIISG